MTPNSVIPFTNMIPTPLQSRFLAETGRIGWVAHWGLRGAGKTTGLLMKCLAGCPYPTWRALFVDPHGYAESHLESILDGFKAMGHTHSKAHRLFTFSTGSKIMFTDDRDFEKHRGRRFDFVAVDFPQALSVKQMIRQGRAFEQIEQIVRDGKLSFEDRKTLTLGEFPQC